MLYLTDSGILFADFAPDGVIRADWRTCPVDGRVYQIDTETGSVKMIDEGLRFPNGIAFGPDDRLYVNETITGDVSRFSTWRYKRPAGRERVANVVIPYDVDELRGPDGMKFAADGSLWVTVFGQGDVTVVDADGSIRDRIKTAGRLPSNLAFGAPGEQRIYVTEDELGTIESFDVGVDGLRLHDGSRS